MMPPIRPSRRQARGAGWHKRGYRDFGNMWINVKEGSYGAVHGQDVNENATLIGFLEGVARSQKASSVYPRKEGWTFDILFRKKSLFDKIREIEAQGLEEDSVLVKDVFDGGETVYFKVYDDERKERCWNGFEWEYHDKALERQRRPEVPAGMSEQERLIRQRVIELMRPAARNNQLRAFTPLPPLPAFFGRPSQPAAQAQPPTIVPQPLRSVATAPPAELVVQDRSDSRPRGHIRVPGLGIVILSRTRSLNRGNFFA